MDRMEKRSEKMEPALRNMKLPVMKGRFLRLDRFLRMTDNLDHQPYCPECRSLADNAEKLAGQSVQNEDEFRTFEIKYLDLFGKINDHLKTSHGYRIPNYFLSLYTLIYALVGTGAGLFVVYMGHSGDFGDWSYGTGGLLGFIAGVITGRITGHRKDRQMKTEHKNLY